MDMVTDLPLVRALPGLELRAADGAADGYLGTMTGHFSVFNTWYRIASFWEGEFLERIAPGAFADTIRDDAQSMVVLYDHGFDPQLGNKVLGPIRSLAEDKVGAAYEVPLLDTSYNRDLLPGLREGLYGSSFRFTVQADSWDEEPVVSDYNPKGLPERTITRARVNEFGPVTFPANPTARSSARSMTDWYVDNLRRLSPDRVSELAEARSQLRLPSGAADTRSAARGTQDGENTGLVPDPRSARDRELRYRKVL